MTIITCCSLRSRQTKTESNLNYPSYDTTCIISVYIELTLFEKILLIMLDIYGTLAAYPYEYFQTNMTNVILIHCGIEGFTYF